MWGAGALVGVASSEIWGGAHPAPTGVASRRRIASLQEKRNRPGRPRPAEFVGVMLGLYLTLFCRRPAAGGIAH
jgi:hypothetical protein